MTIGRRRWSPSLRARFDERQIRRLCCRDRQTPALSAPHHVPTIKGGKLARTGQDQSRAAGGEGSMTGGWIS